MNIKIQLNYNKIFNLVLLILIVLNSYFLYKMSNQINEIYNVIFPNIQLNTRPTLFEAKNDCGKDNLNNYDFAFLYMPSCPHCQKMKSLIEKVESNNVRVYWVDVTNCSEDLRKYEFQGFVPHFYCLRNKNYTIGEMKEDAFQEWVGECLK